MDIASEIVLLLADPSARPTVLTADALLAVATAAYDLDPTLITDPVTAVFDRFDIAVPLRSHVCAMAQFRRTGEPVPWEVSATWDTGTPPPPAADAVWTGSVDVRTATVVATNVGVSGAQPDLDAAFAAAVAALPAGATSDQVSAALRQAALTTLALTDTELDAALTALGTDDPRALGRLVGGRDTVTAGLRMSPPGQDPPPGPVALPVVVAFVAGDATTSPRDLLRATPIARQGAAAYPVAAVPAGAPARLVERLVCWVVPGTTFDDPGWPGATAGQAAADQRAARLAAARIWLAGQGIAVITTDAAT